MQNNTYHCFSAFVYIMLIYIFNLFLFYFFQEVGSIIGKKGEIVKRFREEVSKHVRYLFYLVFINIINFYVLSKWTN